MAKERKYLKPGQQVYRFKEHEGAATKAIEKAKKKVDPNLGKLRKTKESCIKCNQPLYKIICSGQWMSYDLNYNHYDFDMLLCRYCGRTDLRWTNIEDGQGEEIQGSDQEAKG